MRRILYICLFLGLPASVISSRDDGPAFNNIVRLPNPGFSELQNPNPDCADAFFRDIRCLLETPVSAELEYGVLLQCHRILGDWSTRTEQTSLLRLDQHDTAKNLYQMITRRNLNMLRSLSQNEEHNLSPKYKELYERYSKQGKRFVREDLSLLVQFEISQNMRQKIKQQLDDLEFISTLQLGDLENVANICSGFSFPNKNRRHLVKAFRHLLAQHKGTADEEIKKHQQLIIALTTQIPIENLTVADFIFSPGNGHQRCYLNFQDKAEFGPETLLLSCLRHIESIDISTPIAKKCSLSLWTEMIETCYKNSSLSAPLLWNFVDKFEDLSLPFSIETIIRDVSLTNPVMCCDLLSRYDLFSLFGDDFRALYLPSLSQVIADAKDQDLSAQVYRCWYDLMCRELSLVHVRPFVGVVKQLLITPHLRDDEARVFIVEPLFMYMPFFNIEQQEAIVDTLLEQITPDLDSLIGSKGECSSGQRQLYLLIVLSSGQLDISDKKHQDCLYLFRNFLEKDGLSCAHGSLPLFNFIRSIVNLRLTDLEGVVKDDELTGLDDLHLRKLSFKLKSENMTEQLQNFRTQGAEFSNGEVVARTLSEVSFFKGLLKNESHKDLAFEQCMNYYRSLTSDDFELLDNEFFSEQDIDDFVQQVFQAFGAQSLQAQQAAELAAKMGGSSSTVFLLLKNKMQESVKLTLYPFEGLVLSPCLFQLSPDLSDLRDVKHQTWDELVQRYRDEQQDTCQDLRDVLKGDFVRKSLQSQPLSPVGLKLKHIIRSLSLIPLHAKEVDCSNTFVISMTGFLYTLLNCEMGQKSGVDYFYRQMVERQAINLSDIQGDLAYENLQHSVRLLIKMYVENLISLQGPVLLNLCQVNETSKLVEAPHQEAFLRPLVSSVLGLCKQGTPLFDPYGDVVYHALRNATRQQVVDCCAQFLTPDHVVKFIAKHILQGKTSKDPQRLSHALSLESKLANLLDPNEKETHYFNSETEDDSGNYHYTLSHQGILSAVHKLNLFTLASTN